MQSPRSPYASAKVVVLGDTNVGKTSIVTRLTRNEFIQDSLPTVGASFLSHAVTLEDGGRVTLQIWDTAGQERFRSLASMYYRGAAAAILMFDLTNNSSFEQLSYWANVLAVVGNKSDLIAERAVPKEVVEQWITDNLEKDSFFIETSAKDNSGISELIYELVKRIVQKRIDKTNQFMLEQEQLYLDTSPATDQESLAFSLPDPTKKTPGGGDNDEEWVDNVKSGGCCG